MNGIVSVCAWNADTCGGSNRRVGLHSTCACGQPLTAVSRNIRACLSSSAQATQFELTNKPGALAELAGRLAKKGINIDSAYATMPNGAKKAVVVLALSGPTL